MFRKEHSSLLRSVLLQLTILAGFMTITTFCQEEPVNGHFRNTRSIKNILPKSGGHSQARAIAEMRDKITYLESSVKNISGKVNSVDTKLDKFSEQSSRLEQSFVQQLEMMQLLNGEVATVKEVLAGHGEILGNLDKLDFSSDHDSSYSLSNQTCGGVLVGQSGSINFSNVTAIMSKFSCTPWSRMSSLATYRPSTCVWTIRANKRQTMKIQTISTSSTYSSYSTSSKLDAYLVEIKKNNGSDGYSATNLQTKFTKLERSRRYSCEGPVVFVVYKLPTDNTTTSSIPPFQLHYEGTGKNSKQNVFFSHENLLDNSGDFASDNLDSDDLADDDKVSLDYTSIVISNFSTRSYLQAYLDNETCADKDTNFVVITDLLDTSSAKFVDCCKQSCVGKNSLVNYDSPFIVLLTKKYQAPLQFNLSWEAEKRYPPVSEIASYYYYRCGDILGGTTGRIDYKPFYKYKNGERCIWAIIPQPRARTSIEIEVLKNEVDTPNDRLYMMELTDANGTALAGGPKITHLPTRGVRIAHSRELYIVFYSDYSEVGQGFSLTWTSKGDVVRTATEVSANFTILKNETSEVGSLLERSGPARSMLQVFMVTPLNPTSNMYGVQLYVNQTQPTPPATTSGGDCFHKDVTIYAAKDGLFRKLDNVCSGTNGSVPGQIKTEIADGMAMIVLSDINQDSPPAALNFSWKEEFGKDDNNYITIDNNECGGVIKADQGLLQYKLGKSYARNERCVWLLQTPNHRRIKLELLKDGFEPCCDKIVVNTIEVTNGTLRNDTIIMDRGNNTKLFNESLVVISFRSDSYTSGRGFALQFTGEGDADKYSDYSFQLHHRNEREGSVVYPGSDWQDPIPGTTEILVIASSYNTSLASDTMSLSTNITWTNGLFMRERDLRDYDEGVCTYESVSFYTSPNAAGWLPRKRLPREEDKQSCPDGIAYMDSDHIFSTTFSVFLAIYRHVPALSDVGSGHIEDVGSGSGHIEDVGSGSGDIQEVIDVDRAFSRMGFSFQQSSGCGGVVIGDSGEISYREDGKYLDHEKCVWLVEAPQARLIRFSLERNGFEACCDFLYIYNINRHGSVIPATTLMANKTTAYVDGPVAMLVFTSDHSVTGTGFYVRYTTSMNATEPFPYTFQLDHQHELTENRFSFQVEENEIAIAAYSKHPSAVKSRVSVTALRPQIDEACHSDTLTFYNVLGKDQRLVQFKTFGALEALKTESRSRLRIRNETLHEHCPPFANSDFGNCSNSISECTDAPTDYQVAINGTSFIAVYKSANVSTGDLEYRGVSMVCNGNESSSGGLLSGLSHSAHYRRILHRIAHRHTAADSDDYGGSGGWGVEGSGW